MSISSLTKDSGSVSDLVIGVAITLVFLGKMALTSGIGTDAQTALNSGVSAIDDYIDWLPLVVLFGVIIYLRNKNKAVNQ
ncbi:MAG: hypothetical protein D4S01_09010 [Dehalococcoidia bacterium]|nr:MAG: hypothetical protein D4S01_09010 [Dehalococcoidia bacterium]